MRICGALGYRRRRATSLALARATVVSVPPLRALNVLRKMMLTLLKHLLSKLTRHPTQIRIRGPEKLGKARYSRAVEEWANRGGSCAARLSAHMANEQNKRDGGA